MTVKILIKRKVPENMIEGLDTLLRKLRSLTVNQKGYISGETFIRLDQKDESLVISTWLTEADWKKWFESDARAEIQHQIDLMLDEPTVYEIYQHI